MVFHKKGTPTPHTPAEAKSIYNQIQKGGDIPVEGLRKTMPEKKGELLPHHDQSIFHHDFTKPQTLIYTKWGPGVDMP